MEHAQMNIYKIERTDECDYDEYDSAVVIAATAKDAVETYPGTPDHYVYSAEQRCFVDDRGEPCQWSGWPSSTDLVKATLIGTASDGMGPGVVCSSFNAG